MTGYEAWTKWEAQASTEYPQRRVALERFAVWVQVQGIDCNVALLTKGLEHITAHPDEHDQRVWGRLDKTSPCGTAMCIAGHVITMAGHELIYDGAVALTAYLAGDGYNRSARVGQIAQDELRLTHLNATLLFSVTNTLDDLWLLAKAITDGAILRSA